MAVIGIKELKSQTSRVIDDVEEGTTYLVTKRGRPSAVIMPVDGAEDYVLSHAEEFVSMRLDARRAYRAGKTTRLE